MTIAERNWVCNGGEQRERVYIQGMKDMQKPTEGRLLHYVMTWQTLPVGSDLCKKCPLKYKKEVNHDEKISVVRQIAVKLKEVERTSIQ